MEGFSGAEATLVVTSLLVLAAAVVALTPVGWARRQHDRSPRYLWVGARGTSTDGALVHLQAEVIYRVTSPVTYDSATAAGEIAEDALRRAIVTRRLFALPGVGDELAVGGEPPPEGLVVDRVVVAAADAEITGELRRLAGGP